MARTELPSAPGGAGQANTPLKIVFACAVCGAALKAPADMAGKQGRCNICGSMVTVGAGQPDSVMFPGNTWSPRGEETPTGAAIPPQSAQRGARGWRLLAFAAAAPVSLMLPVSLWTYYSGQLNAFRISILNQIFAVLYTYCVLAGGYDPPVIGRLFKVNLDRRDVLVLFLPGLVVFACLAVLTYLP